MVSFIAHLPYQKESKNKDSVSSPLPLQYLEQGRLNEWLPLYKRVLSNLRDFFNSTELFGLEGSIRQK